MDTTPALVLPTKEKLLIDAVAREQSAAIRGENQPRLLSLAGVSASPNLSSRIRVVSYRQRSVLDDLGEALQCDFQEYLASERPYLSSQQVDALLRQGFTVGAHSVDHPLYAELNLDDQLRQTRESMQWLSERFQIKCQSLALPYRDNGVSLDFFKAIFAEGNLKVSFGTGGLIPHAFCYNLSRFSAERSDSIAADVLARQMGRHLIRWKMKGLLRGQQKHGPRS